MDLVLVLPTSSDSNNFESLKSFVQTMLSNINVGGNGSTTQVAVVAYRGFSLSNTVSLSLF